MTTVFHGTSYDSWLRKQERGYFYEGTFVTDRYDVAKEFAVYLGGEDQFQRDTFRFAAECYGKDGWEEFYSHWRPDHPKGRLRLAHRFYSHSTPTILEMSVDLDDFEGGRSNISTPSGAYSNKTLPVDIVQDAHMLSWEDLLSGWDLSAEHPLPDAEPTLRRRVAAESLCARGYIDLFDWGVAPI